MLRRSDATNVASHDTRYGMTRVGSMIYTTIWHFLVCCVVFVFVLWGSTVSPLCLLFAAVLYIFMASFTCCFLLLLLCITIFISNNNRDFNNTMYDPLSETTTNEKCHIYMCEDMKL